jgi:hypothetical protein
MDTINLADLYALPPLDWSQIKARLDDAGRRRQDRRLPRTRILSR